MVNQNNAAPKKDTIRQNKMAERMGVSSATLSRELKRGKVILRDTQWRAVICYSSIMAQDDYDKKQVPRVRT
jgi:IS30 family transposase